MWGIYSIYVYTPTENRSIFENVMDNKAVQ